MLGEAGEVMMTDLHHKLADLEARYDVIQSEIVAMEAAKQTDLINAGNDNLRRNLARMTEDHEVFETATSVEKERMLRVRAIEDKKRHLDNTVESHEYVRGLHVLLAKRNVLQDAIKTVNLAIDHARTMCWSPQDIVLTMKRAKRTAENAVQKSA